MRRFLILLIIAPLLFIFIFIYRRETFTPEKRLGAFYTWTKEDPLFTAPNFGLGELKESLALLDREQKELLALHRAKEEVSIFPIEFLSTLPRVNEKHQDFLEKPTFGKALALLSSYEEAQSYYEEHIKAKSEFLEQLLKNKNKNLNIVYLGAASTPEITLSDHYLILENAKALKQEIEARKKCLVRGTGCIRPSDNFSLKKEPVPKLSKEEFLPDDVIFRRYIKGEGAYEVSGPFAAPTPCFGLNDNLASPARAFYLVTSQKSDFPGKPEILYLELATEDYYEKLRPERFEHRIFIKRGLKWKSNLETNAYDCPTNEYMPTLSTLASFVNKVKERPLLEGQNLEKELVSAQIPTSEQMQNLASLYLKLYSESKNTELREEFLKRGLEGQRLLTDFDKLLKATAYTFFVLKVNEVLNEPSGFNPLFLYFVRGAHSLVYFPFSPSFWRIEEQPTYIQKRKFITTGFNSRYLTYREALTRFDKEEILRWTVSVAREVYPIYLKKKSSR